MQQTISVSSGVPSEVGFSSLLLSLSLLSLSSSSSSLLSVKVPAELKETEGSFSSFFCSLSHLFLPRDSALRLVCFAQLRPGRLLFLLSDPPADRRWAERRLSEAARGTMDVFRSRLSGISVAVAHGVFSGSLNILLKFLITNYHFNFLTLIQLLTSSTAAISLEVLRRVGKVRVPPISAQLCKVGGGGGGGRGERPCLQLVSCVLRTLLRSASCPLSSPR